MKVDFGQSQSQGHLDALGSATGEELTVAVDLDEDSEIDRGCPTAVRELLFRELAGAGLVWWLLWDLVCLTFPGAGIGQISKGIRRGLRLFQSL